MLPDFRHISERIYNMLHFHSLNDALPVFKALGAPMRIRILELLNEAGDKNLNDIAKALGLTNSAVSLHMKILEETGLVSIHTTAGKRGSMKVCRPLHSSLLVDMFPRKAEDASCYEDEISIGCYSACQIRPTCGIATCREIIGEFDDPRYFLFPEHYQANIYWFGEGYVEYILPNHLTAGQEPRQISLSFEISSESPGYNDDYPSDIQFYFNGICLGQWISPGDYGLRKGRFTPAWWPPGCNQYGLLKTLTVNEKGTYIDGGSRISGVTIHDLDLNYNSTFTFRFQVSPDSINCGGFTIFGKGAGDYNQDIIFKTYYTPACIP